ncbi:MAG TPA: DUF72 domain-containing protein [Fimbriimonadaceae bacterium]|nr:DUF72 domain-containing protein [Fimbriimonadaceae bacterium]
MTAYIGLSGYSYKPWQGEGRFYPPGMKQTEFLDYYISRYGAVEMDGTWYRMPSEKAVEGWHAKTPDSFRFSFKLHRDITHKARLKLESLDSVRFMLKRLGPLAAAGKLGPLLIQLPPNLRRNDERLDQFLKNLPTAIEGVAALPRPLEWAVEFRHESWHEPDVEAIMRGYDVAWVAADTDESKAQRRDTGPSHYARLRRTEYSADDLAEWARYFASTGKDCYVYCKHEDEESPWEWADQLLALLPG